jgi:hypothetical protein
MRRLILIISMMLVSIVSYSKDFWEKDTFTVSVTETLKINKSSKVKKYTMTYDNGTLKLVISSPTINKGEIYTFTQNKKTIYYPSLKQTVTQTLNEDEANILSLLNKIRKIKNKNNQTINGDNFKFSKEWLTSVESKGYTANFSDYISSGDYKYPTKISIKDGNSQIIYTFSSFK